MKMKIIQAVITITFVFGTLNPFSQGTAQAFASVFDFGKDKPFAPTFDFAGNLELGLGLGYSTGYWNIGESKLEPKATLTGDDQEIVNSFNIIGGLAASNPTLTDVTITGETQSVSGLNIDIQANYPHLFVVIF